MVFEPECWLLRAVGELFYIFPRTFMKDESFSVSYLFLSFDWCEQEKVYLDNLEASVSVLKRLSEEWKEHTVKFVTLDPLKETIKNFRNKVLIVMLQKQKKYHDFCLPI